MNRRGFIGALGATAFGAMAAKPSVIDYLMDNPQEDVWALVAQVTVRSGPSVRIARIDWETGTVHLEYATDGQSPPYVAERSGVIKQISFPDRTDARIFVDLDGPPEPNA